MVDRHTRQPRGFGFVTFADAKVLDLVLRDHHHLDGRRIEIRRAVPRSQVGTSANASVDPNKASNQGLDDPNDIAAGFSNKIFVGGLGFDIQKGAVIDYFTQYGKVAEVLVMMDRNTGRSRGFGFVTFEDRSTLRAILGRTHMLQGRRLEIKKAEPRKTGAPAQRGPSTVQIGPVKPNWTIAGGGGGWGSVSYTHLTLPTKA